MAPISHNAPAWLDAARPIDVRRGEWYPPSPTAESSIDTAGFDCSIFIIQNVLSADMLLCVQYPAVPYRCTVAVLS